MRPLSFLQRVWRFVLRENLHRLFLCIAFFAFLGTLGLAAFEPEMSMLDALWWSLVTMTTVGYGDISPATAGGRAMAVLVMFFGIGLLGTLSATLAGVLVERKMKEDRGMSSYAFKAHIILCRWNHRARIILSELRAERSTAKVPVVLIANEASKPLDDEDLFFVQGEPNEENLNKANLAQAKTVILLGEDTLHPEQRDAQVVLTALAVESINPSAYTIVELVDAANIRHCRRAKANEIIVASEIGSRLMARACVNHGITEVVSELLRVGEGNELYKLSVPPSLVGKTYLDVLTELKREHDTIVVAVQKGEEGRVLSNPRADSVLEAEDLLIVIAFHYPEIGGVRR